MRYSHNRLMQLTQKRNRLNELGESNGCYIMEDREGVEYAADTYPHRNGSPWNKKRIRIRNRINKILSTNGG